MKLKQYSIKIAASKEIVWNVLWSDSTFRTWANLIDEGTYMHGNLSEGENVEFISSVNGYGVRSLVSKLIEFNTVVFKHNSDTMDAGHSTRDDEWTGGQESYILTVSGDGTQLTLELDIPDELVAIMDERYPLALECIKELAESAFDPM